MHVQLLRRLLRCRLRRLLCSSTTTTSAAAAKRPPSGRLALATELASFRGSQQHDSTGAVSTPIYQTSTFDVSDQSTFDYSRSGNPTRDALQEICRRIEHATGAFAFTSGMSALSATLRLLKPGETVLASRDIYGGMHRLLRHAADHAGINVEFVPTWDLEGFEHALSGATRCAMVCLESPTNPMMRISDIRAIAALCKQHGALLCVDNSVMSPALSTPLDIGADIVIHSATKYINGHADVMAGIVCVNDDELAKRIAFVQNAEGNGLAPFDSWLVLRGVKTLALRMSVAQANAIEIAEVLRAHPLVSKVHYLSPNDVAASPDAALHFSQARGGGALLSFETGDVSISRAFVDAATAKRGGLFKQTVSFGSVASLVEMPAEMSHASIPASEREGHLPDDLVRISVGIEDVGDLVRSLSSALAAAQGTARAKEGAASSHNKKVAVGLEAGGGLPAVPFGVSLPLSDSHAVGVSMPTWDDVVSYEVGSAQVLNGYPRFVFLPPVQRLFETAASLFAAPGEVAMAMPSARAALRLQKFLTRAGVDDHVDVHDFFAFGVFAVTYPARDAPTAKAFWQHCGEIVSSRLATEVLTVVSQTCYENQMIAQSDGDALDQMTSNIARGVGSDDHSSMSNSGAEGVANDRRTSVDPIERLRRRVSSLAGEDVASTFVYPTGMASIAATHRLLMLASSWDETPLRNIVFGFSYLDTLKLNARRELGGGCVFYGQGDRGDLDSLRALLQSGERFGGLFCEMPSNPLLRAPPLAALRTLCDEFNIPLVVDDSVVGPANVDVLGPDGADIVVSSLTKQFSGENNAMGGSLVLNSQRSDGRMHARLHSRLLRDDDQLLWRDDAAALLSSSADYEARACLSNENTMRIIAALSDHSAVERIYHPSVEENWKLDYDPWRRAGQDGEGQGYGSLFSILLKDTSNARVFYDRLDTAKGPGFGSNFSLVCPYTMIARACSSCIILNESIGCDMIL